MYTCLNLPLTAAYYFGAPIAGMASVISGYPAPLMVGGKKKKICETNKTQTYETLNKSKIFKKIKIFIKEKKKSSRRRRN